MNITEKSVNENSEGNISYVSNHENKEKNRNYLT